MHKSQSKFREMLEDFSKAISLDPTDADLHYERGTAQFGIHELEAAIEDFSAAIDLK